MLLSEFMIDLRHAVLIVNRTERDEISNEIIHIMEKSMDLHFHCSYFLDDNGDKVEWEYKTRKKLEDGLVEYHVYLNDKTLELPHGTVLHLGPEKWYKVIPDGKVIRFEYRSTTSSIDINSASVCIHVCRQIYLSVSILGEVYLERFVFQGEDNIQKEQLHVEEGKADNFLKEMLRCVSEIDCYTELWADDTSRELIFVFSDGKELRYNGVFYHDEVYTEKIIREFLTDICSSDEFIQGL